MFRVGDANVAFGVENEGVFVKLNASPTNCTFTFPSRKLNVLDTFSSILKNPGPLSKF
ncbi:MAG: hypothetical protein JWP63_2609, partial [Candidatus Solibacter sp.]|nr:hypothetical protein [Candidatus Solibacter sp.]